MTEVTGALHELEVVILGLRTTQKALLKLGLAVEQHHENQELLLFMANHLDHVVRDLDDWHTAAIQAGRAKREAAKENNGPRLVH